MSLHIASSAAPRTRHAFYLPLAVAPGVEVVCRLRREGDNESDSGNRNDKTSVLQVNKQHCTMKTAGGNQSVIKVGGMELTAYESMISTLRMLRIRNQG